MKKTGYISMKNKDIDLNFFFGLWRIKISTTCKNPHISIINIFWVILKKLIKTTLNFWKSGNKPLSLFFPRGRGHAEIIFWVWDIYRTRSNSFYIFAPHRFPSPLNINSTSQHQADRNCWLLWWFVVRACISMVSAGMILP